MTTDPTLELLATVIAVARTHPAVVAVFEAAGRDVSVWNEAPPLAPGEEGSDGYPYLEVPTIQTLGDEPIQGGADDAVVIDDPSEVFVDVHVFSRQRPDGGGGPPECMAFVGALKTALGRELEVAGFRVTLGHFRDARHFTESDRLTGHSVATFRYLIQPV